MAKCEALVYVNPAVAWSAPPFKKLIKRLQCLPESSRQHTVKYPKDLERAMSAARLDTRKTYSHVSQLMASVFAYFLLTKKYGREQAEGGRHICNLTKRVYFFLAGAFSWLQAFLATVFLAATAFLAVPAVFTPAFLAAAASWLLFAGNFVLVQQAFFGGFV